MGPDTDNDAMVDACIAAAEQVKRSGSPELQAAMRVLLILLGRALIDRENAAASGD